MTEPMIVPPPDEADGAEWVDVQSAAHLLRDEPRYVVVDLGPGGLPQVSRDDDGDYSTARTAWHEDQRVRLHLWIADLLAIDAAMHAPTPAEPAVDAVLRVMGAHGVPDREEEDEAQIAAEIVAAVRAADGKAGS